MSQPDQRGSKGVPCPSCDNPFSLVRDSRNAGPEVNRLRQCLACQSKYKTVERLRSGSVRTAPRKATPKAKKPKPAPTPVPTLAPVKTETRLEMIKRLARQHSDL